MLIKRKNGNQITTYEIEIEKEYLKRVLNGIRLRSPKYEKCEFRCLDTEYTDRVQRGVYTHIDNVNREEGQDSQWITGTATAKVETELGKIILGLLEESEEAFIALTKYVDNEELIPVERLITNKSALISSYNTHGEYDKVQKEASELVRLTEFKKLNPNFNTKEMLESYHNVVVSTRATVVSIEFIDNNSVALDEVLRYSGDVIPTKTK